MNFKMFGLALAFTLVGCGSGSSGSSGDTQEQQQSGSGQQTEQPVSSECAIENDTISLASGEQCELTAAAADAYRLSAGTVICNDGTIEFNSILLTGSSSLNGLTFSCGNS